MGIATLFKALLMACLLAWSAIAVASDMATPRIIGGVSVGEARPWMAELEISRSGDPRQGATLCGGTLVAPAWVLTAAHCVRTSDGATQSPAVLFVSLGHLDRTRDAPERLAVRAVHVHEGYRGDVYHNDLALLELASPSGQRPLDLAKAAEMRALESSDTADALLALGWGRTENSALSDTLQQAALDYVSPQRCARYWNNLGSGQLCAVDPAATRDTCRGDSGGPLIYQKDGHAWLAGVTSYGTEQCASGAPAVYTRVNRYLDWIERTSRGAMVDLESLSEADALYAGIGESIVLQSRITNLSLVNGAERVGLRLFHDAGLRVRADDLGCRAGDGYSDCSGGDSVTLGASSGSQTLRLSAAGGGRYASQIRVTPISDSHDYYSADNETFQAVFSDLPDLAVQASVALAGDDVRLQARVSNRATHRDAHGVWVSVLLPAGWDWRTLPAGCVGTRPIRCELGDLARGQSLTRTLTLSGAGAGRVQVDGGGREGDFPTGDTRAFANPASAATEAPRAQNDGSGGGGGGGGASGLWLLAALSGLWVRRRAYA